MKLSLATLSLLFTASAAIDCNQVSISRASDQEAQVCAHFDGEDHQPYLDWYDSYSIGTKYSNQIFIPGSDPTKPENGMAVHWKIDDEHVHLALAARATGWLGFGIGEAGTL